MKYKYGDKSNLSLEEQQQKQQNHYLKNIFNNREIFKSFIIIVSISLVISLYNDLSFLTDAFGYSLFVAYAQSSANLTQAINNTDINRESNDGGTPTTDDKSTFNVVAVGDFGCKPESNRTVSNMLSKDPELVLALGDFSYQDSAKCWIDMMKPFGNKTKITLGNHEWPFSLMMEYVNHFNLSRPYYGFDMENVHVLSLSNEFSFDTHSPQYRFAEDDLMAASANPLIDWIFVFYHKPMYASQSSAPISAFREAYHPLFDRFGVDLALQGHIHNYERTYPIEFNEADNRIPIIAVDTLADGAYVDPRGPIVATVGTGGHSIHQFKDGKADFVSSQYLGNGILDIVITNNPLSTMLNATYYNNDNIIQDQFSIQKPRNSTSTTGNEGNSLIIDNLLSWANSRP